MNPTAFVQHSTIVEPAFSRQDVRMGMVLRSTGGRRRAPRLLVDCDVRVTDCSIVNLPEAKRVAAHLRVVNQGARVVHGHARLAVVEPGTGKILASAPWSIAIRNSWLVRLGVLPD